MDRLCAPLTPVPTNKMRRRLPCVFFGKDYWDAVLNVPAMVDWGTISAGDLDLVFRTDSVDDAFDFLVESLESAGKHPDQV